MLKRGCLIGLIAVLALTGLVGSKANASAAAPTITGISPSSGPVGTVVTVSGSGFTGATKVTLKKQSTSFTVESDGSIEFTVPTGAHTGAVTVETASGSATTKHNPFKVTPDVSSFSPLYGPVGTQVTILGQTFSKKSSVEFGGLAATQVTYVSSSELLATVPVHATTGHITVTNSSGSGTSADTFPVGPVFNVDAYGAMGNKTGDNTPAFAAAISAAQSAGGGIVAVPAGTYDFATGSPTSIQIDGTVPIALAGAGRGNTELVELTRRKDLLSISCDGSIVQDLSFDTETHSGGHGIGVRANDTTVQRVAVTSGTLAFGFYYAGPPDAQPGNGLYNTGNVVNDVTLDDHIKSDGFSFSFQKDATISNVVHTGSRLSLYADTDVTVTNYQYTPGGNGANAGWVISSPCDHITIDNFVSSGEGGQIRNAPNESRMNSYITIDDEQMTGGSSERLLIGDVTNLVVENSALQQLEFSPNLTTQGVVSATTYSKLVKKPQHGGTVDVTISG